MSKATSVIYTAQMHTTGGRERGIGRRSDGQLAIKLVPPGSRRSGPNPEQLFAAGWSACFEGAIALSAYQKKLSADVAIDAEVGLHLDDGAYVLSARLKISVPGIDRISLPGIDRSIADGLVADAKGICPYSKATHGNIAVTDTVARA
jgi:Ohr subfamily peroxiredoxin